MLHLHHVEVDDRSCVGHFLHALRISEGATRRVGLGPVVSRLIRQVVVVCPSTVLLRRGHLGSSDQHALTRCDREVLLVGGRLRHLLADISRKEHG